jgi:hypothetical protein
MTSERIQALFEHEVVTYQPDVVLVYGGANDTIAWADPPGLGRTLRVMSVDVSKRLLFWALLHSGLARPRFVPIAELRAEGEARAATYVARMRAIRDRASGIGLPVLLVTQQLTALHALGRGQDLSRLSYADEAAAFRLEAVQQGGVHVGPVAQILTHSRVMEAVRGMAGTPGIVVVDGIRALDPRREVLRSWVHLSEEGNEALADAIAEVIRTLAPTPPAPNPSSMSSRYLSGNRSLVVAVSAVTVGVRLSKIATLRTRSQVSSAATYGHASPGALIACQHATTPRSTRSTRMMRRSLRGDRGRRPHPVRTPGAEP